jgi:hypothetical protein
MYKSCTGALARRNPNPLPGWQQGISPADEPPVPAPVARPDPEQPDQTDYSTSNPEWMLQLRAVNIVKRLYGIRSPFDWKPAIHDRKARAVFDKLMRGEPIPDHWRTQYREPPPIDPSSWIQPRQCSS